ncbi:hypothetical protein GCM10007103_03500 [Salinimicrobium marinum]|uniref:Uncharacterized protein n=1 Tax=Salinimicrobium marinum TaxID=680283 RepID=A0A918S5R6_9FLAO|nr:hypothetical protein [Salinimicrobium marinum]GHA25566.1 hypothetical protein GCM10007103_03500 [Salinimicrobium marinum]
MDEDMILEDLTVGIWTIHSDGISCKMPNRFKGHAGTASILAKREVRNDTVWDLPIHIAKKDWVSQNDIINLMQALVIYRGLFSIPRTSENLHQLDEKTTLIALDIVNNKEE